MQKKYFNLLCATLLASSLSFAKDTPPAPPPMPPVMGNSMPKECAEVPPMIVFLPPPLEEAYYQCKNALHLPKKEDTKEKMSKLLGKDVKISSIKVVDGFAELYSIEVVDSKNIISSYFCNRDISKCILNIKVID